MYSALTTPCVYMHCLQTSPSSFALMNYINPSTSPPSVSKTTAPSLTQPINRDYSQTTSNSKRCLPSPTARLLPSSHPTTSSERRRSSRRTSTRSAMQRTSRLTRFPFWFMPFSRVQGFFRRRIRRELSMGRRARMEMLEFVW